MELIQQLSLSFSILALAVAEYWYHKDKKVFNYLVPAAIWLGHTIFFYTIRLLDLHGVIEVPTYFYFTDHDFFSTWSAFLRFHSIFTVFYSFVIMSNITHDIETKVKELWKKIQHK